MQRAAPLPRAALVGAAVALAVRGAVAAPLVPHFSSVNGGVPASAGGLSALFVAAGIVPFETTTAAPPPPFWPLEWSATVTQLNTTSNTTGVIDYAFSMTHNSTASSVLGPPVPTGQVYESFEFYWAQTTFTLYGPPANLHCIEAPLPGSLIVPDVQNFIFNGTQTVNGQKIWLWLRPPFAYGTQRTPAQLPVVWVDGATGTITFFSEIETFNPPALWPPGQWMVPEPCSTRSNA